MDLGNKANLAIIKKYCLADGGCPKLKKCKDYTEKVQVCSQCIDKVYKFENAVLAFLFVVMFVMNITLTANISSTKAGMYDHKEVEIINIDDLTNKVLKQLLNLILIQKENIINLFLN